VVPYQRAKGIISSSVTFNLDNLLQLGNRRF
jgi:hypothetical protein